MDIEVDDKKNKIENDVLKENKIENELLENGIELSEEENKFFDSTFGKIINSGIDIGSPPDSLL